jgi:hypothetical protein
MTDLEISAAVRQVQVAIDERAEALLADGINPETLVGMLMVVETELLYCKWPVENKETEQ